MQRPSFPASAAMVSTSNAEPGAPSTQLESTNVWCIYEEQRGASLVELAQASMSHFEKRPVESIGLVATAVWGNKGEGIPDNGGGAGRTTAWEGKKCPISPHSNLVPMGATIELYRGGSAPMDTATTVPV
jgi:hypothetical protein